MKIVSCLRLILSLISRRSPLPSAVWTLGVSKRSESHIFFSDNPSNMIMQSAVVGEICNKSRCPMTYSM